MYRPFEAFSSAVLSVLHGSSQSMRPHTSVAWLLILHQDLGARWGAALSTSLLSPPGGITFTLASAIGLGIVATWPFRPVGSDGSPSQACRTVTGFTMYAEGICGSPIREANPKHLRLTW